VTRRAAIIGAGTTGTLHALAWSSLPGVEVATVVDPDEAAGRALAERHGASFARSLDEAPTGTDVASVCSPTHLHVDHVLAATERGADVLLEKPAATVPEDLGRMLEAADATGVRVALRGAFSLCPEARQTKAWIEEGRIGRLAWISETSCADGTHLPEWYFRRESSGGGVLLQTSVHSLDRLLYLTAARSVETIRAEIRSDSGRGDVEDYAKVYLYLDDVVCLVEHSWRPGAERHRNVTIVGTRGTIGIAPYRSVSLAARAGAEGVRFHPEDARYLERVGTRLSLEMGALLGARSLPREADEDLMVHRRSLELVQRLYGTCETAGSTGADEQLREKPGQRGPSANADKQTAM
jgi:predicted dehydrogenase